MDEWNIGWEINKSASIIPLFQITKIQKKQIML